MEQFYKGFSDQLEKTARLPLPLGFGKVRAHPLKGILTSKFTKTPQKLRRATTPPIKQRTFGV